MRVHTNVQTQKHTLDSRPRKRTCATRTRKFPHPLTLHREQVNLALRRCVAANQDADAALALTEPRNQRPETRDSRPETRNSKPELDDLCAKAWYRKGRAQEGLGRLSSALTCFERAVGLLQAENKMHAQVLEAIAQVFAV
jgi:hypothetical protein